MKKNYVEKNKAFRFRRFANKSYSAFNSLKKVVSIGVLTIGTLASVQSEASAENADTTKVRKIGDKDLDEVMVTASRVEMPANQVAKMVTVITQKDVEQAPVQSIQDLLNFSSSVDVLSRGGHGVQADISIRGGTFDQTAILLNGVNLSNPQIGHYSFDIPINLNDIERIEIIHGPSSMIYGASAFSGGINIITKKHSQNELYGKLQAGGHNLFGLELGGAYKLGITENRLSFGYNKSDGYIKNSDYDIKNFLWQTRFNIKKNKIDLQLGYNHKSYGANTFYSAKYPNQYDETSSYLVSLRGEFGQKLKFIPLAYWNRHYDDYQLIKNSGQVNNHMTDVFATNLNLQYESKIGITSLGTEIRNEGIMSSVLGKPMNEKEGNFLYSDNRTNASFMLEHNLLLKKFTITAGLLSNYNTSIKESLKLYPSVNISYNILENLKAYASWSNATRLPTFTDMYIKTPTHQGSSDIKPEKSESIEIGFKNNNRYALSYITGYFLKGSNMIDWVKQNPDDEKWKSKNISELNKFGLEIGVKLFLKEFIPALNQLTTLNLGYTRIHQDVNSHNFISNYVLNYLRDKFTAELYLPLYKDKLSTTLTFRYQKRMGEYLKYENLQPTIKELYPAFTTLDVKVNYKIKELNVFCNINNMYDTYYFDLGNIPQQGFWMMFGVSYTLK